MLRTLVIPDLGGRSTQGPSNKVRTLTTSREDLFTGGLHSSLAVHHYKRLHIDLKDLGSDPRHRLADQLVG